jgi:anti-sigma factor RsiW
MDVLISFYIDGDLSNSLKKQVEEHIASCSSCRAKYDIIKSMLIDLKTNLYNKENTQQTTIEPVTSQQYRLFKDNLSAYIDNELTGDESLKVKKFTISNPKARKELEENYSIKRLINNSLKKTQTEVKHDFSRSVLKQLEPEDELNLGFHPAIKLLIIFTVSVLVLTTSVLFYLNI